MAVTVPSFIPEPFANEGQKATIPDTPSSEQGRASWQLGFPQVCAQPLASGGIPPNYLDFQGIFNALSSSICYIQTGALWPWSASLTYPLGAHVLGSDNNEYVAVQENSGQDPTTDTEHTFWQIFTIPSNYIGATASEPGTAGLVPPATAAERNKFLKGDGTWAVTSGLPLTGGTLTGALRFNLPGTEDYIGQVVATNDQHAGKRIVIDTWEEGDEGALLALRKGSDTINPGGFEIWARNADGSVIKILEAATDGNLWWDGKQIVRSVNGALADSTGNVSTMPVGSVYVQFAGQSAPADLFGGTWSNVSSTYAGLFFRAEGGAAAAFGSSQGGGLPNITGTFDRPERNGVAATSGAFYNPNQNGGGYARDEPISSANVGFSASRSSALYGAANEVRPVNSTIRIWKRTA